MALNLAHRHSVHLPLALVYLCGCLGAQSADTPCDPLAAEDSPLALADIVVAAIDEGGAVPIRYVVDEIDDEHRVFVEVDGVLQRREVTGSGEGSSAVGDSLSLSFDDAGISRSLVAELPDAGDARVALCMGDSEEMETLSVDTAVAAGCTEISAIDEASVSSMDVASQSATIAVEYHAALASGEEIIVLRPESDWSYEDFRLFFGTPDAMAEREVIEVMRAKDGGSTDIDFRLDGASAHAFFGANGEAWLDRGGPQEALTPSEEPLGERSFTCF